jgi:hypothetical protein
VARKGTFRFRLAGTIVVALAAAAFAVPAANADLIGSLLGSNCPSSGTQVFAPWGDLASYFLAPNGGLESGSNGWSLTGASVVGGNEPFLPTGTHSLSLPSGSTALSPVTCIGPKSIALRLFASDAKGTDSGLRVRVRWYGLLNKLLGISDYAVVTPGGGWSPTGSVSSRGGVNVLVPLLGSTSARVEITPIGSGGNWRIDDLYIDPWLTS